MAAPRTLLQRALTDLDRGPPDIVALFGPAKIRELTVDYLRVTGCGLTGDAETVERLISYVAPEVSSALLEWERSWTPPRKGRPRNDLFLVSLYAAAWSRFRDEPNATALAAGWLGEPATKDRVANGLRRFLRTMHVAYTSIGASGERMIEASASIIDDVRRDLERLAQKIEAERVAETARRKAGRFSSFSARL